MSTNALTHRLDQFPSPIRTKEGLMASPKVRRAVAGVLAAAETLRAVNDGSLAEFEGKRDELRAAEADRKAKFDRVVELCLASKDPVTQSFGDLIAKTGNVDAEIGAKNFSDTALAYLSGSRAGQAETIIRALVAAGADVNAKCDRGSPLEYAFEYENYRIAGFLITNGADLNLERHKGGRILNLTLQERLARNPEAVRAILWAGVDPNVLNVKNGIFPVQSVLKTSKRLKNTPETIFILAAMGGYVSTIKIFLEQPGFDPIFDDQASMAFEIAELKELALRYAGAGRDVNVIRFREIRSLIAEKMAEKSTGRFSRLKWQAISRFRKFFRIGY